MPETTGLTAAQAELIVNSLQSGTVPIEYAHLYNVGREVQIQSIREDIAQHSSGLKFINGDYGQGKTQMLAVIRHWAISNGYAASHVVLTSRGTTLGSLRNVYGAILRSLWRPDARVSALQAVLEVIVGQYRAWVAGVDSWDLQCPRYSHISMLFCHHCYEAGLVEQQYLPGFRDIDPVFRRAVSMYRRSSEGLLPDRMTREAVLRFLQDDLGYRQGLNFVGMWLPMTAEDVLAGLAAIARILRLAGLKGLVIALDEAEAIPAAGPAGTRAGYQNLAALIAAAEQASSIYFLYATTPSFFEDAKSYAPALARRISKGTQMDLPALTIEDYVELAQRIESLIRLSRGSCDDVSTTARQLASELLSGHTGSVRNFLTGLFGRMNG